MVLAGSEGHVDACLFGTVHSRNVIVFDFLSAVELGSVAEPMTGVKVCSRVRFPFGRCYKRVGALRDVDCLFVDVSVRININPRYTFASYVCLEIPQLSYQVPKFKIWFAYNIK